MVLRQGSTPCKGTRLLTKTLMIMNEKQFIQDMWDVLLGNTQYITQEQFVAKYRDFFVYADSEERTIHLADDHNEWHINMQKTWTDNSKS